MEDGNAAAGKRGPNAARPTRIGNRARAGAWVPLHRGVGAPAKFTRARWWPASTARN